MKRTLHAVYLSILISAASVSAASLVSTDATFITENPYFTPGHNGTVEEARMINFSSGDDVFVGGLAEPPQKGYTLVLFDLSSYSGHTVTSDATFSLYAFATPASTPAGVSVSAILTDWDVTTVTFDSFVGPYPETDISTKISAPLSTLYSFTNNAYNTWTISASTIQGWIDSPETNHGFLIYAQGNSEQFYNIQDNPATLEFSSVPEPTTVAFLALGLALIAFRVRKSYLPRPN